MCLPSLSLIRSSFYVSRLDSGKNEFRRASYLSKVLSFLTRTMIKWSDNEITSTISGNIDLYQELVKLVRRGITEENNFICVIDQQKDWKTITHIQKHLFFLFITKWTKLVEERVGIKIYPLIFFLCFFGLFDRIFWSLIRIFFR